MYSTSSGFYPYSIDQSLRFDKASSTVLHRTPSSASNRKTWSFSCWIKRSNLTAVSTGQSIFSAGSNVYNRRVDLDIGSGHQLTFFMDGRADGASYYSFIADRLLRDTAAWMHIMAVMDTTDSTADDRLKLYVNGERQSGAYQYGNGAPPLNSDWYINSTYQHDIGDGHHNTVTQFWDGYIAEVHHVDGTALDPTSFGETKGGVWVPKEYSGSHGTNGFYLSFADSSAIGDDLSGNTNDFTPTNLAAHDVVPDSPTLNYSTIVPMPNTSLSEGNLRLTTSRTGNWDGTIGSFGVSSGKWYHEVRMSLTEATFRCVAGWIGNEAAQTVTLNGKGGTGSPFGTLFDNYAVTSWLTSFYKDGGNDGTMTAPASGDVMNIAADFDNGKIWFGINGTYYANDGGTDGDPSAGTNESLSGIDLTASEYVPFFAIRSDSSVGGNVMIANFGQEGTFAGTETDGGYSDGNGYGSFFNSVPSGFLALASANLPEPAIGPNSDTTSDQHFDTALWTADVTNPAAGDKSISLLFQPDLVWSKNRDNAEHHYLMDSVRGDNDGSKWLKSNSTAAEGADAIGSTTAKYDFTSTGFDIIDTDSTSGEVYYSPTSRTYVGWCWKAGGTAVSNTDGSITSSVSANPDAGFSICTYTGTATVSESFGHGLSQAPELVITKARNTTDDWRVHGSVLGTNKFLSLSGTGAVGTDSSNGGFPDNTDTVVNLGYESTNGTNYVAYCFHSVEGYSKVGSYVGNGSADGTFVYTGHRVKWLMVKNTDNAATSWWIMDTERSTFNVMNDFLFPNLANAESASTVLFADFLSNGFKIRNGTYGETNASGNKYIYLAFGDSFKYANAR
jgi:hypothetical protein